MIAERIHLLQNEILELENELIRKKSQLSQLKDQVLTDEIVQTCFEFDNTLKSSEVSRYSRQLILPNFGLKGQQSLKRATVLIVGIGGLGCPAALYLAAAGVGHLVLIDSDKVETTNLARQIIFDETSVGKYKAVAAATFLNNTNPHIQITPLTQLLTKSNISEILTVYKCDAVIDATDNILTRYLLNDYCAYYKVPLISGSALQWEGQLTVYNYNDGPCYRCILPVPPSPEFVTDCADGGVLGSITGCIGTLQALETVKVLSKSNDVLAGRMLIFDGECGTFKVINLRKKNDQCLVCGSNPIDVQNVDYVRFCKLNNTRNGVRNESERVSFEEFYRKFRQNQYELVIDVRSELEFNLYKLKNSIYLSMDDLENELVHRIIRAKINNGDQSDVIVICRRGNDSQIAVEKLSKKLPNFRFKDVIGGLNAFHQFHPNVPIF